MNHLPNIKEGDYVRLCIEGKVTHANDGFVYIGEDLRILRRDRHVTHASVVAPPAPIEFGSVIQARISPFAGPSDRLVNIGQGVWRDSLGRNHPTGALSEISVLFNPSL